MKAFGPDGKLYKFFSTLFMIIEINFLWMITSGAPFFIAGFFILAPDYGGNIWLLLCIPFVVLMGPATVAAQTLNLKIVEETEGRIFPGYFKAYKENLKLGIPLGAIFVFGCWAMFMDFQLWNATENVMFLIAFIVGTVIIVFAFMYAFPLMARYENTFIGTIKNSIRISARYFFRTLLCVFVVALECASVIAVILLFGDIWGFALLLILGAGVVMYSIAAFAMIFFKDIEKRLESGE